MEERDALAQCLAKLEEVVKGVNESQRASENLQQINALAQRLDDPDAALSLIGPNRYVACAS